MEFTSSANAESASPSLPWLMADFTFVARDPKTNGAAQVPPLLPETEDEQKKFEIGEMRADMKKKMRKAPPLDVHQHSIHDLLDKAHAHYLLPNLVGGGNYSLMDSTKMDNTLTCQPQHQNTAGRIFGGFLMRRAFELAHASAYTFSGHRPRFLEVDQIVFKKPVNIGDLLRFTSRVLYTKEPVVAPIDEDDSTGKPAEVHVEVVSYILQPETCDAQECNKFYFTFAMPPGVFGLKQILPESEDEARTILRQQAVNLQHQEEDLLICPVDKTRAALGKLSRRV